MLVHVKTIKGKGYEPAEERPAEFHGTAPFHIGNGEKKAVEAGATYHRGVRRRPSCARRATTSASWPSRPP